MKKEELQKYRETIPDETLRLLVKIYAFELHGLPYFSMFGNLARLTDEGRQLAEKVFFEEEEYRNEAMTYVDNVKKYSFREDWNKNYLN